MNERRQSVSGFSRQRIHSEDGAEDLYPLVKVRSGEWEVGDEMAIKFLPSLSHSEI
jgi:hypothetical protein